MADQFLALSRGRTQERDTNRHCDVIVNDRSIVVDLATAAGATVPEGRPCNFLPLGKPVEIVEYREVQFTNSAAVPKALDTEAAREEMRRKGFL